MGRTPPPSRGNASNTAAIRSGDREAEQEASDSEDEFLAQVIFVLSGPAILFLVQPFKSAFKLSIQLRIQASLKIDLWVQTFSECSISESSLSSLSEANFS